MIYYSIMKKEISRLEVQEGELAIYTGTVDPRQANGFSLDSGKRNAYVFLWKDGQPQELYAEFHLDGDGLDVLDVSAGEEKYTFLRDHPSGYIRQIAGPAAPIVVANLGAIPLRMDTLLGKFTVHAGTILRLDENAPQREKKTVLLTVSSQQEQPLTSAELWDGNTWRRLNIREEPADANEERSLTVLDGSAIVQYMSVNSKREIWMMDAPEPDPDYEICVTAQTGGLVTLRFDRTDYREGRVVQRARTIFCTRWGMSRRLFWRTRTGPAHRPLSRMKPSLKASGRLRRRIRCFSPPGRHRRCPSRNRRRISRNRGGYSMNPVTFGVIRRYCSRINRVSICRKETLEYQNFRFIDQVPHSFDPLYLYGVGAIESEFFGEGGLTDPSAGELNFLPCMEFMLSETPREEEKEERNDSK